MNRNDRDSVTLAVYGHSEFVQIFRNSAGGSDLEVVIQTSANNMKTYRLLLAKAIEQARQRDKFGEDFDEEVAAASRIIEKNDWLIQGVNTAVIDSRWDWRYHQLQILGSTLLTEPLTMTDEEQKAVYLAAGYKT